MPIDIATVLDFLQKAWPFGGSALLGGGIGWLGKTRQERGKRSAMERHLYKELSLNYAMLDQVIEDGAVAMANAADGTKKLPLEFRYYDHALKDMDRLIEVTGYTVITSIYDTLREIDTTRGMRVISLIVTARTYMDESMVNGLLNQRLFEKESSVTLRPIIRKNVAQRRRDLADMPKA